jgi:hypothetical protein
MRFLWLIILSAAGIGLILKTDPVVGFTGRIGWAEKTFGATGTYTFYKLLGVALIFIGLMYATGFVEHLVNGFLSFIFPGH